MTQISSSRLICVVDDSADHRFLLQQLLRHFLPEQPVLFFVDGKAFLDSLDKITPQPSLVLLDRHMPELDGHQILTYLKQHPTYQTIPVVMMSSTASQAEIYACYEAGVNSFIIKPTDFEALKRTIITICEYWLGFNQEPVRK